MVALCRSSDFFEVVGLGLHLVEQSCIFNCDDGLVGEGLDELDLFVVEGAGFAAEQRDNPNWRPIPQQGNAEASAKLARLRVLFERVFWVRLDILDLNGFAVEQHPPAYCPPFRHDWDAANFGHELV